MTFRELADILGAEVVVGDDRMEDTIRGAFASDLLSDVLAFAREGALLITGITNPQVVRTAEMLELLGIVFAAGLIVAGTKTSQPALSLPGLIGLTVVICAGAILSKLVGAGLGARRGLKRTRRLSAFTRPHRNLRSGI